MTFYKYGRYNILCIVFFAALYLLINYYNINPYKYIKKIQLDSCPIPIYEDLSIHSKETLLLNNLQCPKTSDLIQIINGRVFIIGNYTCTYQCISWKSDFAYKLDESIKMTNYQRVPCQYFIVSSKLNKDDVKIQLIMTAVKYENVSTTPMTKDFEKSRDVLILGLDSMSYVAYKRYLPITYNTLHNELNGISFKKFNTLGDATTINLQGLLTGTKNTETYESRKRIAGAKTVDDYNWIWKHFKNHGYMTQYYEDHTRFGGFQYRLLGFKNQPTDIYLRTPLMYTEETYYFNNFCLGNKPQHLEIFRFYKETLKVNENPNFSFIMLSRISHDDNKYVSYLDKDISKFLKDIKKNNPTMMIILYSDHGQRINSRFTMQGKYEERLPFLGISLPEDLKNLLPVLKSNSEILISGLDVHATLEDILGIYKPQVRNRHMSLLRDLPKDRTCDDIESAEHWCACLNWKEISKPNSHQVFINQAKIVVEQISNFTLSEREFCAELKLDHIQSLYKMDPNKKVLTFKQSLDIDGKTDDFSDKTIGDTWIKLVLKTKPADALFEITLLLKNNNLNEKISFKVDEIHYDDVSRINKYDPWIKCLEKVKVASKISDIRKFCICKDSL